MSSQAAKLKPVRWRRALHPDGSSLFDIGVAADGTVLNPRGYPEAMVMEALIHTAERVSLRRKKAAAKATVTRTRRRALKVDQIAKAIVEGKEIGPRTSCAYCGRGLTDQDSIKRGVGTECWGRVLAAIEAHAASNRNGAA